jgi:hypothetical protein
MKEATMAAVLATALPIGPIVEIVAPLIRRRPLLCRWSRNPATRRLACRWDTDPVTRRPILHLRLVRA